jgi:hypothetical protein
MFVQRATLGWLNELVAGQTPSPSSRGPQRNVLQKRLQVQTFTGSKDLVKLSTKFCKLCAYVRVCVRSCSSRPATQRLSYTHPDALQHPAASARVRHRRRGQTATLTQSAYNSWNVDWVSCILYSQPRIICVQHARWRSGCLSISASVLPRPVLLISLPRCHVRVYFHLSAREQLCDA